MAVRLAESNASCPTQLSHPSRQACDAVATEPGGMCHATSRCSWLQWWRRVSGQSGATHSPRACLFRILLLEDLDWIPIFPAIQILLSLDFAVRIEVEDVALAQDARVTLSS